jgi:cellulose synthase/poly-beta-1,6-N-acetylglucosamine synthase-like glycosyltransferase
MNRDGVPVPKEHPENIAMWVGKKQFDFLLIDNPAYLSAPELQGCRLKRLAYANRCPFISSMIDLSIIIPVFNEEQNIPVLVTRLRQVLSALNMSTEMIFVNDGSRDNTIGKIKEMAKGTLHKVH